MSLNSAIGDVQFEFALATAIKRSSANSKSVRDTFHNGVPHQMVLVFKTICCLPDEELNTRVISEWYGRFYGDGISSTSTVRNLHRLEKLGFVDLVDNPHNKSHKYTWIKLTASGRRLQKLYIGASADWKDKPRVTTERQIKSAMNGGFIND